VNINIRHHCDIYCKKCKAESDISIFKDCDSILGALRNPKILESRRWTCTLQDSLFQRARKQNNRLFDPGTDMDWERLRLSHMQKGAYCKGTYYVQVCDNDRLIHGHFHIGLRRSRSPYWPGPIWASIWKWSCSIPITCYFPGVWKYGQFTSGHIQYTNISLTLSHHSLFLIALITYLVQIKAFWYDQYDRK
jgi:hypothetical protein